MSNRTLDRAARARASSLISSLALLAATTAACEDNAGSAGKTVLSAEEFATASAETTGAETPAPEYTSSELSALKESPEVKARHFPFADIPRADAAFFIHMSDGVRLALNLHFPPGFDHDAQRAPVLYVDEWYGRAEESFVTPIELYLAAGFVVALVDGRGFGASFGSQSELMPERARQDQAEVASWLASQPWSTGQVSTLGLSLSGNLAAMLAVSGAPALKAAVIRAADFDQYTTNLFPGGVPNLNMLEGVAGILWHSRGEPCVADLAACAGTGFQPVEGDDDYRLLQAAFRDHQSNLDGRAFADAIFRDDTVQGGAWSAMTASEPESGLVPARVVGSWLDGTTAESALLRFATMPNTPMEVSIGATDHLGGLDADPFSREPFRAARPDALTSFGADQDFIERALAGKPIQRSVRYLVLGTDVWKQSAVWPPSVATREFAFAAQGQLASRAGEPGRVSYRVDPETSGGEFDRWASQRGNPIYYGDRRSAVGRYLVFDSAALEQDSELVGAAELCLALTTDQPDGLVMAYLEDVSPDGRVTYLTEGELRLLHRKTGSSGCDPAPGTDRSFQRADAAPVVPGEPMRVEIPFLNVAALVQAGHRLRVSLSGANAGTFPTLTEQPAHWSVAYGGTEGSTLRVPLRPWQAEAATP